MKSAKIYLIAFSLTSGISCQITEPEPIIGTATGQPEVAEVQFGNLDSTRSYTGQITVVIPDTLTWSAQAMVNVYIDQITMAVNVIPGQSVNLGLGGFQSGEHLLWLGIYEPSPALGMVSLLGAVSRVYATLITIDHSPPTVVQNLAVQWSAHPVVTWQPSPDANFYGYIVRRHDPTYGFPINVDTIYARTQVTYTDSTALNWYGNQVFYSIGTWNGADLAYSATASAFYGTPFPVSYIIGIVNNAVNGEVYVLNAEMMLSAISPVTHQILRQVQLTGITGGGAGNLAVSEDGGRFFFLKLLDSAYTVQVFDAAAFAFESEWVPVRMHQWSAGIAAGKSNDVFYIDSSGRVLEVNGLTGVITDSTAAVMTMQQGRVRTTPDRDHLLLTQYDFGGFTSKLTRIDIASGSFSVLQSRIFDSFVYLAVADSAFTTISVSHGPPNPEAIELLDPGTFATTSNVVFPPDFLQGSLSYSQILADGRLHLCYSVGPGHGKIVAIGLQSGAVERTWDFLGHPLSIHRPAGGGFLYVFDVFIPGMPGDWIVPL